ncbi:MAG: hypothetical protein KIT84_04695 [Labilithrix sp.]|nr:hypothetical protein [Labilithrix sp.]MCW5810285.1 hypothetical protein [Labilithrix sp.]
MSIRIVELQDSVFALARHVEAIDIRKFESHAPTELASELAPIVMDVLRDAHRVVSDVARLSEARENAAPDAMFAEGPPLPYLPFERALDAAVVQRAGWSLETVGDLGFLARLEIHQRLERLERLAACHQHWAIIGECDGALRRIRKALTAIDRGLERAGAGKARLDYSSELEISLDVRRAYGKLRARVRSIGAPQRETFYVQVRAIGTALATVVGWRGYANLRVRDRMQMRELQRRLLEWFRSERDVADGQRLWEDIDAFVTMLVDVNQRQELREHDGRLVHDALAKVMTEPTDAVPAALIERLSLLEGLDDEADALLHSGTSSAAAWRPVLARLASELARTREGGLIS